MNLLFDAFSLLQGQKWELVITGRGGPSVVDACRKDSRIRQTGLVDDGELAGVYASADVFVSPRDPLLEENKINFPSKLLEYLVWGKPVISTWTGGISPMYRDALIVLDHPTPHGLAALVSDVSGWTAEQRIIYQSRVDSFLSNHTWTYQAERLVSFLRMVCGK
jgi:glycosyltransferase involved in cell wall biosynthesis